MRVSVWSGIELTNIQLRGNYLKGIIPSSLSKLTKLFILNLEIIKLINLGALELFENQLGGKIPSSFDKLTNLVERILAHNQLSGALGNKLKNKYYSA